MTSDELLYLIDTMAVICLILNYNSFKSSLSAIRFNTLWSSKNVSPCCHVFLLHSLRVNMRLNDLIKCEFIAV